MVSTFSSLLFRLLKILVTIYYILQQLKNGSQKQLQSTNKCMNNERVYLLNIQLPWVNDVCLLSKYGSIWLLYSLLYIRHHILPFSAYPSWQYFPFSTSISQSEEISTLSASCGVFTDHHFQRLICFKVIMSNFPIYIHKYFILNCHRQKRQVYFCFWRQRPLVQDFKSRGHLGLLSKAGIGVKHPLLLTTAPSPQDSLQKVFTVVDC